MEMTGVVITLLCIMTVVLIVLVAVILSVGKQLTSYAQLIAHLEKQQTFLKMLQMNFPTDAENGYSPATSLHMTKH
jgi:predicted PurR-regulated permease PerM